MNASIADKKKTEEYYDDVYFDSENEDEDRSPGIGLLGENKKTKTDPSIKTVLSDDQLLYDPNLDDEDEAWVTEQIKSMKDIQINIEPCLSEIAR
ncbi:hypothetical protein DFQ30_010365 [Apophysomyces sp. BC1015]|nr:hypothetical protein DFQ30_010365 [Apophysomyces sp. BC1015]